MLFLQDEQGNLKKLETRLWFVTRESEVEPMRDRFASLATIRIGSGKRALLQKEIYEVLV
jgi:hypothetical protein